MENRNRFVLMQEVAELAVKKHGGVVYGGYVRDFMIHEAACIKFFGQQKHTPAQFEDVTVSPETANDRLLVPKDIDIHFQTRAESMSFEMDLKDRSFKLQRNMKCGYGNKFTYSMNLSLEMQLLVASDSCASRSMLRNHFRENVTATSIPGGQFTVDITVCPNEEFPMNLDFECNGLVLTRTGITLGANLSMDLSPIGVFRRLQEVTDDIMHKRARVVNLIEKRWKKMDEKEGWELYGLNVHKVKTDSSCGGDICIVCHEELPSFRLACCNARYHKKCLAGVLDSDFFEQCIHCRSSVYIGEDEKMICVQG